MDSYISTELRIAASGMAWMGNETKRVVTLAAADLKWAMWMRVARNYQLRVGMKGDRQRETFDGFTRDVYQSPFCIGCIAYIVHPRIMRK